MSLLQAIILGIIQGLTEFLPVSSSGHLILVPHLLGWPLQTFTFDVALHLGTLLALILFFYKKWLEILKNRRYLIFILLGSIPAALAGFLFEDFFENRGRSPLIVASNLVIVAFLMFLAEKKGQKRGEGESLTLRDVLIIGTAQSLALMPGVSRSGVTIAAGLYRDLRRDSAAEFSFILGVPIILGAGFFRVVKLLSEPISTNEIQPFVIGVATAATIGFLTIKYLLKFLKTHTLLPFIFYRIALGLVIYLMI